MHIAFYAPMKPPTHATPSGDRTMARALMSVLGDLGKVDLVSNLQTRDGVGDVAVQEALFAKAAEEVARLRTGRWDAWVTYHTYYKAPDLIGPEVSAALGIPYIAIEATRASKRLIGPWARFTEAAEASCDAADVLLYLTERDREALVAAKPEEQIIQHLRPFLEIETLPVPKSPVQGPNFLAVGMLREGDKLASYTALAQAFSGIEGTLDIIGDGPARPAVEALFAPFADRVRFIGQLDRAEVLEQMRGVSAMLWPGVNEAFGMVYLEAQSVGLRCVAEDRPGVRDVVGPTGLLCPAGEPEVFAAAVQSLSVETAQTIDDTRNAMDPHLRGAARRILANALGITA